MNGAHRLPLRTGVTRSVAVAVLWYTALYCDGLSQTYDGTTCLMYPGNIHSRFRSFVAEIQPLRWGRITYRYGWVSFAIFDFLAALIHLRFHWSVYYVVCIFRIPSKTCVCNHWRYFFRWDIYRVAGKCNLASRQSGHSFVNLLSLGLLYVPIADAAVFPSPIQSWYIIQHCSV